MSRRSKKSAATGNVPMCRRRSSGLGELSLYSPKSPRLIPSLCKSESSHDEDPPEENIAAEMSNVSRDVSQASLPKAKKAKRTMKTTDLTLAEEESMAEWLEANECLYNKKVNTFTDKQMKDKLWDDKAAELGKRSETLQIWYRSLRTRYGRLLKKTSGQGVTELTERDEWVLAQFAFLKSHIYAIKAKAAAAAATSGDVLGDTGEAGGDDGNVDVEEVQPSTVGTSILDVRPKKSTKTSTAEEDRLLAGITERGQQSLALQQKMLEMLKPPAPVTERSTYADWTKSVMEDLDTSLWRRFQLEHSQLLYRYLGMNDDIKHSSSRR